MKVLDDALTPVQFESSAETLPGPFRGCPFPYAQRSTFVVSVNVPECRIGQLLSPIFRL